MSAKPAALITKELLTTEPSSTLLTTAASRWSLSAGAGQMIQGFEAAVADMEVGEVKEIHLMPEEAYGQANPDAIFDVEIADLPGSEELQVGQRIYLQNQNGQHSR